jgi:4a-hydroxytetrahydrobiopterin dehydratase
MSESPLARKTCVPCAGGVAPLGPAAIAEYLEQTPGWRAVNDHHLAKEFTFPDFVEALAATNRIGKLAEQQGHHPDLHLGWGRLGVEIWTHKIDGLTESDFILAAKIDEIV